MKKLPIILTLLLSCILLHAQQKPQPALGMNNYSFLNPAMYGVENYSQVQGMIRRQWIGVDGAPATNWFIANIALHKNETTSSVTANERPSVTDNGHGIGIQFYQDKIGPYAVTSATIGYAYHLPLSSLLSLSAGFSAGVNRYSYDLSKNIYPGQVNDPAVSQQAGTIKSNQYTPELNAGVMLYGQNFFAGMSAMQLIPQKFLLNQAGESKEQTQYMLAAGYRIPVNDNGTGLWLSSAIRTDFANPLKADFNAKMDIRNLLWFGVSYRANLNIGTAAGYNVCRQFMVAYQYEWNITGNSSPYGRGSHELMLVYRFLKEGQRNVAKIGW